MYNCEICLKNPAIAKERRCQEPGFDNLRKPRRVDDYSQEYSFCPGKATWFEEIAVVFEQCRIAFETGIMPTKGALDDQAELFTECFPTFVFRWKDRTYNRVWADVQSFTKIMLEAIFPKK